MEAMLWVPAVRRITMKNTIITTLAMRLFRVQVTMDSLLPCRPA